MSESSLFNAHTMILIVHIFMNVNKLCLNQNVGEAAADNNQSFAREAKGELSRHSAD